MHPTHQWLGDVSHRCLQFPLFPLFFSLFLLFPLASTLSLGEISSSAGSPNTCEALIEPPAWRPSLPVPAGQQDEVMHCPCPYTTLAAHHVHPFIALYPPPHLAIFPVLFLVVIAGLPLCLGHHVAGPSLFLVSLFPLLLTLVGATTVGSQTWG